MLDGNKHFEETYNKLVDQYQQSASQREFKFASVGMGNVMYPDETLTPKKLLCKYQQYKNVEKNHGVHQSLGDLKAIKARHFDN